MARSEATPEEQTIPVEAIQELADKAPQEASIGRGIPTRSTDISNVVGQRGRATRSFYRFQGLFDFQCPPDVSYQRSYVHTDGSFSGAPWGIGNSTLFSN